MPNASTKILDALIEHDVDVERFLAGATRATVARLDELTRELRALTRNVNPAGPKRPAARIARLERLYAQADKVIASAYREIAQRMHAQARELAAIEAEAVAAAINAGANVTLIASTLTERQVTALLRDATVEGRPARAWWRKQGEDLRGLFRAEMRRGFEAQETIGQLTTRMRRGPLHDRPRRQARTLVRTSFQSVTQAARKAEFEEHTDVLGAVKQVSTLDDRTSLVCIAYDGARWSLPDYKPIAGAPPFHSGPPRHFNCRSAIVPVVKSLDEIRGRRLKGGKGLPQQTVDRRFIAEQRKLGVPEHVIEQRRARMRSALDGLEPEGRTYLGWLRRQPAATQRRVLGRGRWELWRSGDLTDPRALIDQSERPLTLADLRARLG